MSAEEKNSNDETEPEGLWTVRDVARWAKVSPSWVYRQSEAGRLPSLKVLGVLRFDPPAIKAFFLHGGPSERRVIPITHKPSREGR